MDAFYLLAKPDNGVDILLKVLKILNVNFTKSGASQSLVTHPDYPSMLSISDILKSYGVENITFKTTIENFEKLPLPIIVPINNHELQNDFVIIKSIKEGSLTIYNPRKFQYETKSYDEFQQIWNSGIVMVLNSDDARGEKNYLQEYKTESLNTLYNVILFLTIPVLAVIASAYSFLSHGWIALPSIILLMVTLIGSFVTAVLLLHEVDERIGIVQKVCGRGGKVDCHAILASKASKILGISWSSIGFVYFFGSLIFILVCGVVNAHVMMLMLIFSLLSLPFVVFSVYYQWRVARQWCSLCLVVQGLLLTQFLITGLNRSVNWSAVLSSDGVGSLWIAIVCYSLISVVLGILLPSLKHAKESKARRTELIKMKQDPSIFHALLEKQKQIDEAPEHLGIVIGNPNPTYKIIKVCNPYCEPCANAHIPLEELLLENPNIQLQIIFSVSESDDHRSKPVKHLLAIDQNLGEEVLMQAIDDWYRADKKNYDVFAEKYPLNGEIEQQASKVKKMKAWCDQTNITFTPTIFVNGHQLPDLYNANDLRYFLSV